MSHNVVIKEIAKNLSNLAIDAVDMLEDKGKFMSDVNSEFLSLVGEDDYEWYVESFSSLSVEDRTEFDSKEFYELTDDERKLRRFEYAEAYILLYLLCVMLKRIQANDVILAREMFGEGQVNPLHITQLMEFRDTFYERATASYLGTPQGNGVFFSVVI